MSDDVFRCKGCRVEVRNTVHTLTGYEVHGYRLFVGERVPAAIQGREDDKRGKEYLRLVDPETLWLCPRCVRDRQLVRDLYVEEAVVDDAG